LRQLDDDQRRPLLRAATEADALNMCVGLWIAARRPLVVIQQLGLFAAANALRWIRHEVRAPLPVLVGLFGRDVQLAVSDDPHSAVRLSIPLLDALEIGWSLVEGPADADRLASALAAAFEREQIHVVLLGAPTA
jgi:sulfopyruvate decarboxylase TPP-binding subunit